MQLSPEERQRIYEEEKARIQAEERAARLAAAPQGTGLEPRVAALLCYLAGWVSGIVFLVLEQRDRYVRYHALQSIIVFGTLNVAGVLLSYVPVIGNFLGAIIGVLALVLWIVLMVKSYQGERYRIPVAGDIAAASFPEDEAGTGQAAERQPSDTAESPGIVDESAGSAHREEKLECTDGYPGGSRALRVTASGFAIAWSFILLIFFSFFSGYIAYYQPVIRGGTTIWNRYPLLTGDYYQWLPILVTTLILAIAGHILLIIYDRYWLRQLVRIVLYVLGTAVVVSFITIAPYNFAVIPGLGNNIAVTISIVFTIVLIAIAIALGISALVTLIKLVVRMGRNPSGKLSCL